MRVLLAAALALLLARPAAADGLVDASALLEAAPVPADTAPPAHRVVVSTLVYVDPSWGRAAVASPSAVQAVGPYMRPLDLASPRFVAGGYFDPERLGESQAGTALALLTHSPEDGCLFPSVVCTDWTPLAAGVLARPGDVKFAFGPLFNLAPVLKAAALRGLNLVSPDESLPGLKARLGSEPLAGPGATVSIGPAWVVSPAERFKGYFRVFTGAELRFGKKK